MSMLWKCRTDIMQTCMERIKHLIKKSHLDIWRISAIFVMRRLKISDLIKKL